MDRSGLASIEDANSAGILPASRDSPKFEPKAQFPGNSPFQKPRTAVLRGFRGVRVPPSLSRLYGANFGLIWRSAGPTATQCCLSTRNAGADQRVQSRIQVLAPVHHWHSRIADRQAPCLPARLDTESLATLHCFLQRVFWCFRPHHFSGSATARKTAVFLALGVVIGQLAESARLRQFGCAGRLLLPLHLASA